MGTVPFTVALDLKEGYFDSKYPDYKNCSDLVMNTLLGATFINTVEKIRVGNILKGTDYTNKFLFNILKRKISCFRLFDGAIATGIRDGAAMTASLGSLNTQIAETIKANTHHDNPVSQWCNKNSDFLGKFGASAIGAVISHPADMIGTRAQIAALNNEPINYKKIITDLKEKNGMRIFARGFIPRLASLAGLMTFYPYYKNKLTNLCGDVDEPKQEQNKHHYPHRRII